MQTTQRFGDFSDVPARSDARLQHDLGDPPPADDVAEGRAVISGANLAVACGVRDINDPCQRLVCNGLSKHVQPQGGRRQRSLIIQLQDDLLVCPLLPSSFSQVS